MVFGHPAKTKAEVESAGVRRLSNQVQSLYMALFILSLCRMVFCIRLSHFHRPVELGVNLWKGVFSLPVANCQNQQRSTKILP